MRHIAHWDDAPTETSDLDRIGGTEQWLSGAVGSRRLGASRQQIPAGKASTPQHAEDEEVFYVLGGGGWSVQTDGCFAIGAGDVVYYRPFEIAHTIVAGDEGIDYIAMGTCEGPRGLAAFPRLNKVKVYDHLLEGDTTHQWELENALGRIEVPDPPDERPATIVNVADVEGFDYGGTIARRFLGPIGVTGLALNHVQIGPGGPTAPLHCHSTEEELFVVIAGAGVLILGDEEHPVRTGSVVGRPPGTGIVHGFRAGADGMEILMFSDKHPNDLTFYPESGTVTLRGLGITFKPEIVPWGG